MATLTSIINNIIQKVNNLTSSKVNKVTSTDNAVVRFNGTTGEVQNSDVVIDDNGNVGVGVAPAYGLDMKYSKVGELTLRVSNTNTSDGSLAQIRVEGNSGNSEIDIRSWSINSTGTSHGISKAGLKEIIDNSTTAASNGLLIGTNANKPLYFGTNGTEKMRIDGSGNLLLTSVTGALGYGAGAFGAVTQLINKSTAVTLHKASGWIIMDSSALAAGESVYFTLNNDLLQPFDGIVYNGLYGSTSPHNYRIETNFVTYGAASIRVTNISNSTLSEALEFSYKIIKGAHS